MRVSWRGVCAAPQNFPQHFPGLINGNPTATAKEKEKVSNENELVGLAWCISADLDEKKIRSNHSLPICWKNDWNHSVLLIRVTLNIILTGLQSLETTEIHLGELKMAYTRVRNLDPQFVKVSLHVG